jgi:hypothetical protein
MDVEDFVGGILVMVLIVAVVLGMVFLSAGTLDSTVVDACKDRGYWQTGQTRVICSVEAAK